MKRKKLIFVCVFILISSVLVWYVVYQDTNKTSKEEVSSTKIPEKETSLYYMKFYNNDIVIYNSDHSVYEFTDLKKEFLPAFLIYEIEQGKYFKNQQELYEFLETYTS